MYEHILVTVANAVVVENWEFVNAKTLLNNYISFEMQNATSKEGK